MTGPVARTTVGAAAVRAAADRLREAAMTGVPAEPVRDLIGRDDVAAAYAVQSLNIEARTAAGARVVGRKIGLTSSAVQQQLGVDQPDFGILLDDMGHTDGAVIPVDAVLQPRAEAEIAFVLGADLVDGDLGAAQVRASTAHVVVALEVCGSRVADWDISFGDTVADNASAGAYVLGAREVDLADLDTVGARMTMSIDDVEVSTGSGAACLGDPVHAVVWLARRAREFGNPLRAGQVVLSGALGPMRAVETGQTVRAEITGLGSVGFTLAAQGAHA
ncbi:2-keto-4-pentenoate hydratase [Nocardioides sp. GXZ039]|uniref:2-keto-4-pentenoate hydratase n=1 Tax=Nocardioides sp. GXZ039 TaxID=3136018 RepID=UPI0030F3AC33